MAQCVDKFFQSPLHNCQFSRNHLVFSFWFKNETESHVVNTWDHLWRDDTGCLGSCWRECVCHVSVFKIENSQTLWITYDRYTDQWLCTLPIAYFRNIDNIEIWSEEITWSLNWLTWGEYDWKYGLLVHHRWWLSPCIWIHILSLVKRGDLHPSVVLLILEMDWSMIIQSNYRNRNTRNLSIYLEWDWATFYSNK